MQGLHPMAEGARLPRILLGGMLLGFGLVAASGCGGSGASVDGTVTLDDTLVDGGMILFFPYGSKDKPDKARADIVNGKYSVSSRAGLAPGKYRVEIFWFKKTGRQVVSKGDPPNMEDETIQMIPTGKYNGPTSILSADITSGSNTFDYPIKTKK
jgi:hypothetical protein